MKTYIVKSQEELDNLCPDEKFYAVDIRFGTSNAPAQITRPMTAKISGSFVAEVRSVETVYLTLYEYAKVQSYGTCKITLHDDSTAEVHGDNDFVTVMDNSTVYAQGRSVVETSEWASGHVVLYDSTYCINKGEGNIFAQCDSFIVNKSNKHSEVITLSDNARIVDDNRSPAIYACENARIMTLDAGLIDVEKDDNVILYCPYDSRDYMNFFNIPYDTFTGIAKFYKVAYRKDGKYVASDSRNLTYEIGDTTINFDTCNKANRPNASGIDVTNEVYARLACKEDPDVVILEVEVYTHDITVLYGIHEYVRVSRCKPLREVKF